MEKRGASLWNVNGNCVGLLSKVQTGVFLGRIKDKFLNGEVTLYPLQPNMSMHIFHTVLSTFPKVLTVENLVKNQELH